MGKRIILKEGPAKDALIVLDGVEIFATSQRSYLVQSPSTLDEDGSAILLNPSYWWYDAGREPQVLRIEKRGKLIVFSGRQRLEQTNGDSTTSLGQCDLSDWLEAVKRLP